MNYYSFAANYANLRKVIWILHQSAALTLARKLKLKTLSKVFSKFGRLLEDPETGVKIHNEESMKVKHLYKVKGEKDKPRDLEYIERLLSQSRSHSLTKIGLFPCAICGSTTDIQMHHLRKAKDVREKIRTGNSTYKNWTGGFLRKQVPLCKYHHGLLHKGQLNHSD